MSLLRSIFLLVTLIFASVASTMAIAHQELNEVISPEDVILTVINNGETLVFDHATLESLPATTFTTTTVWTEGEQKFTGVALSEFLEHIEAKGSELRAQAINDYSIEMPMSEAISEGPIIAYERNDEPMTIRDKGPLWIVYPYDSDPKFKTDVILYRSIWQLDRMEIVE